MNVEFGMKQGCFLYVSYHWQDREEATNLLDTDVLDFYICMMFTLLTTCFYYYKDTDKSRVRHT